MREAGEGMEQMPSLTALAARNEGDIGVEPHAMDWGVYMLSPDDGAVARIDCADDIGFGDGEEGRLRLACLDGLRGVSEDAMESRLQRSDGVGRDW